MDYGIDIKNCVDALINGETLLYPTDTIWGIGCDATNEAAIQKVFAIKNRPTNKSMIVLLASISDVFNYVAAPPPEFIELMEDAIEPTTFIFENGLNLAEGAINEDGSVAIRVTKDPFCRSIIKRSRLPLLSTSANVSGVTSPRFFHEIDSAIINNVDYVAFHRREDFEEHQPSRIKKLFNDGRIEIIR